MGWLLWSLPSFQPSEKFVISRLPLTMTAELSLSLLRDSSFQHIRITMLATAGSIWFHNILAAPAWYGKEQFHYRSLSLCLPLFLLTDVLNQWHPNSFTALFPWAWGFAADAFRVKSFSSRARPSFTHLGVCPTITHAICTNCSICVWIWNAFPEYDWRPYLSPKRAVVRDILFFSVIASSSTLCHYLYMKFEEFYMWNCMENQERNCGCQIVIVQWISIDPVEVTRKKINP